MIDDTAIPKWASDKRTFMRMNVALGAALTALFVGAALIAPVALRSVVKVLFSPLLLLGLGGLLLVVSAVRWAILGPARKQKVGAGVILVTYLLAALPLTLAALALGVLATLALVFQWQPRFDLVQALWLLLVGFVWFSMAVKTVLNSQLLMRHWFGR